MEIPCAGGDGHFGAFEKVKSPIFFEIVVQFKVARHGQFLSLGHRLGRFGHQKGVERDVHLHILTLLNKKLIFRLIAHIINLKKN